MTDTLPGFWLPRFLRQSVLSDAEWNTYWLRGGIVSKLPLEGAQAVRWPSLSPAGWQLLLDGLQDAPRLESGEVLARWESALLAARAKLGAGAVGLLSALVETTGYSAQMLGAALLQEELVVPGQLAAALAGRPDGRCMSGWQPLGALPGLVKFTPSGVGSRLSVMLHGGAPLHHPAPALGLMLGYAAGNVPGTALLITLLGSLANCARPRQAAPALLVRNSRHEPLFAPWVFDAIEEADPDLVRGVALLIWDHSDEQIHRRAMQRAGLMISVAGDEALAALEGLRRRFAPAARVHHHGHKVSFALIGRELLEDNCWLGGGDPYHALAHLAAVDSSIWDQNGCLSARIHFVTGDVERYAESLARAMRDLAMAMPRGSTPRRMVHQAFDHYAALMCDSPVALYSSYEDDFLVALDRRPWSADELVRALNLCAGRSVIVRPVDDLLEAASSLRVLQAANLQSLSLAIPNDLVLPIATAAAAAGVTAIRSLGRAAFPKLAYSWDGLLPLDIGWSRPPGHFTTIEFDDLVAELAANVARWRL